MSEKTTIIEHGGLFQGCDAGDYINSYGPDGQWIESFTIAHLVPDEARSFVRQGRFEITVKFTPAESEVAHG